MSRHYQRTTPAHQRLGISVLIFAVLMSGFAASFQPTSAQEEADDGVEILTGTYTVENPLDLETTSGPFMVLWDLTGFINRDLTYHPALESQIVTPVVGDLTADAEFRMSLPIRPQGEFNVFGENDDEGVQAFSLDYTSNRFGDPFFSIGEQVGWASYQSSIAVSEGYWEIIGGKVIVWAPDDEQVFSSGFGDDGLFLTDDDPTAPIEAGWTVIDLDSEPFEQIRDAEVEIEIARGNDQFTDLSSLSMVESFDALVEEMRILYAFTELKNIDFDALSEEYRPRIVAAEADDDFDAYQFALFEFGLEFSDGHVGTVPTDSFIEEMVGGRLGMRIMETDDGDFIVVGTADGLPADEAGIEPGALILAWDGGSVEEALEAEPPIFAISSDHYRRLHALEFLTRGTLGETVEVTFQNPDGAEETVELTFSDDIDGADFALNTRVSTQLDDFESLPISSELLPSGIGYIRVNNFLADPVMITAMWDYAVTTLLLYGAEGFIIDVRDHVGGWSDMPFYVASTFYDEEIPLATWYFPDGEGGFVPSYVDRIVPNGFDLVDFPVAVLTDADCGSACENLVAAMAVDPDNLIVSYTPTAGVMAAMYTWTLPEGLPFYASFARAEQDGEIHIDGVGVPPNVRIPSTPEYLILSDEDTELVYTEEALLMQMAGEDPRNVQPTDQSSDGGDEATPATPAAADNEATPAADLDEADEAAPSADPS